MSTKLRLIILNFLQFYVWGAWLITIANYWFGTKQWDATQFALIFSTMGIASLFMPTLAGIIADKWMNAERVYGLLHLGYAGSLLLLTTLDQPSTFFWGIMLAMIFYMPTIALNNSVCYIVLKKDNKDIIKDFPPIRVWGTVGFIAAMWVTNLMGWKATTGQFYNAAFAALFLGVYSFTLPKCQPDKGIKEKKSITELFGLDAFRLFKNGKMATFFLFAMFLGGALQLTNAYGDVFLDEFKNFPRYADSFVVKYSTIIMSISQVSETLFILTIPFFLNKFGIKKVMILSMIAWVLRFALFGFGNPHDGLWMIILSCVVYGMAFDFFNVSGSLFVESTVDKKYRSSAQGIFMLMTNGIGAILGSLVSGWAIDQFFTFNFKNTNELASYLGTTSNDTFITNFVTSRGITVDSMNNLSNVIQIRDWTNIWISFSVYALIIAVLFALFFKHKHNPEEISAVKH